MSKRPKNYIPDADDNNVRTKYKGAEYSLGDRLKVINRQLEDCVLIDNLQIGDILALVYSNLLVHLPGAREVYEDDSHPDFYYGPRKEQK